MIDIINSMFMIVASILTLGNIPEIKRKGTASGVSFYFLGFVTLWAFWNIIFYYSTINIFSTFGGVCLFTANLIWFYYVWKYKK